MRERGEAPFAIFTLIVAVPYFLGETYHYFAFVGFGNDVLNYVSDLIAIFLMVLAGRASLRCRPASASGWLAAAWGFVACLNYRAFSWRYEARQAGDVVGEPSGMLGMLGVTLAISFVAFGFALYLSRPRA